jgi:chloramphenicol O-acetyltransferase
LTASETITLHTENISGTDYNYDLRSIAIDENMFYCLNQDVAMSYTVIDNTASESSYSTNKITLWQFISAVCSVFGFAIRVKDDSPLTYELAKSSLSVTVADNDTFSRVDETILAPVSEGYTAFRKFWNVRSAYQSTTPTDIEEKNKIVVEGGKEEITLLKNLQFFLRDIRPGQPNGKLLATATYEFPFSKLIERQTTLREDNYLQKKIITSMRFDIPMVLENYINPEKMTSEIAQENAI